MLLATDAGSVKASCEEAGQAVSADELAHELQKQCSLVSGAPTSQVIPGLMTGQLCATTAGMPANVGISTSEQLRQLLALLSKKNDSWSLSPSDRQLVVTDELQNSISKVCSLGFCFQYCILYIFLARHHIEQSLTVELFLTLVYELLLT